MTATITKANCGEVGRCKSAIFNLATRTATHNNVVLQERLTSVYEEEQDNLNEIMYEITI
jgi:hypothetical protein